MLAALYIIPLTGLGIDIYVPSLPAVVKYFAISDIAAQDTVTIYVFGLGISQLICGDIIDHYGRRMSLLVSLACYVVLSLLIVLSKSIDVIINLRLIQGICMGFSAVAARSVFIDLFSGEEYYKKASYGTIAYAMGPILAPAIGGYLQHFFGWQSNFYFLFFYSILGMIIVFFFIPETINAKRPLNLRISLLRYTEMLTHKEFILGVLCISMLMSVSLLFNLIGPFLVQDKLHYSPVIFGQVALLCGFSWFMGNTINRMLLRVSINHKITLSLIFIVIDLTVMLVLAHFWFNLYVMLVPICLLLIASSIMFSNYFVHSPTLLPQYTATASAFMAGAASLLSSQVSSFLAKILTGEDQVPLIGGYFILITVCIIAHLYTARRT